MFHKIGLYLQVVCLDSKKAGWYVVRIIIGCKKWDVVTSNLILQSLLQVICSNRDTVFYEVGCMLLQVICCEGNSGFYEVGCMVTPMEAGYSVLGWNHPGFAGSTVRQ